MFTGSTFSGSNPAACRGTAGMSSSRGWERSSQPPASGSPSSRRGSSAAVAALRPICPAAAADSISAVRLAPGPLMSSSRWIAGSPTRKKSKSPLWMPTEIRNVTEPDVVDSFPAVRSTARMRYADRAARSA